MTVDKLSALKRSCPQQKNGRAFKNHDVSKPELIMPIDKFMLALMDIPRCEYRVDCMLAVLEFEEKSRPPTSTLKTF